MNIWIAPHILIGFVSAIPFFYKTISNNSNSRDPECALDRGNTSLSYPSVFPGDPGVLVLVLHQQPASVRDLSAVRQCVSSVGYTQDLPVGIRRSADVAVAADDGDVDRAAVAVTASAAQGIHRLLQRHQRGRATLAVHILPGILLESPECQISAVAEVPIAAPGAEVVAQLQQHLLHQLHVLPLAAILDNAVAQRVFHGMDRPLILAAVRQHDDGVSAGLGNQDIAPAQIRGLTLVLAAGELGERAGLVQIAGHVARPSVVHHHTSR